ncbi:MAG TPA: hypothetical protein VM198_02260 [Longimicrobiales bacterium]|nr:hypothetical protein [Longimicrobiales bacterium]
MNTIRGLSLAIALAGLGAAPIAAQQEGHQHRSQLGHQHDPAMMGSGMCQHMTMAGAALQSDAALRQDQSSGARTERRQVRRATGPSRIPSGAMIWVSASPGDDAADPDGRRVRRSTGPSRLASGVMVSPATTPAVDSPGADRKRARRATGPSRIPIG